MRFGLLASWAAWCTRFLGIFFPLPLDISRWHGTNLLLPVGLLGAAIVLGFYFSLGGKPAFQPVALED